MDPVGDLHPLRPPGFAHPVRLRSEENYEGHHDKLGCNPVGADRDPCRPRFHPLVLYLGLYRPDLPGSKTSPRLHRLDRPFCRWCEACCRLVPLDPARRHRAGSGNRHSHRKLPFRQGGRTECRPSPPFASPPSRGIRPRCDRCALRDPRRSPVCPDGKHPRRDTVIGHPHDHPDHGVAVIYHSPRRVHYCLCHLCRHYRYPVVYPVHRLDPRPHRKPGLHDLHRPVLLACVRPGRAATGPTGCTGCSGRIIDSFFRTNKGNSSIELKKPGMLYLDN